MKLPSLRNASGPRRRAIVIGLSVLGLAMVIAVASALWPKATQDPLQMPSISSDQLYRQAEDAAASGDTTAALEAARRALVIDPSSRKAKELISRLEEKLKPVVSRDDDDSKDPGDDPDPSVDPEPGESPDDGFTTAISNLEALLPVSLDAYSLDPVVKTAADASVSARPDSAGAVANKVLWAVHDRETAEQAASFLTKTSRELYGSDGKTLTVDGVDAYFGTDSVRFATVAYVRGRFVFEVIVSSSGGSPADLEPLAVSAAGAFGDARPE